MTDIHIVTVATESKHYLPQLQKSCNINGGKLNVLGFGRKWTGFNMKFKLIMDYLNGINDSDIVCFVDGYDVICCRKLNELKKTFYEIKNKHKCKIIVSRESAVEGINAFLVNAFSTSYFGKCKENIINSGTYIGQAKDLKEIMNSILHINSNDYADDQVLLTQYCNNRPNDFYIDIHNEIFLVISHCLTDLSRYVTIENGVLECNNNKPFFFHAPFYGNLDNVIKKLHYDNNPNVINTLRKELVLVKMPNALLSMIKNNLIKFIIMIIFMIIFITFIVFYFKKNNANNTKNIKPYKGYKK